MDAPAALSKVSEQTARARGASLPEESGIPASSSSGLHLLHLDGVAVEWSSPRSPPRRLTACYAKSHPKPGWRNWQTQAT